MEYFFEKINDGLDYRASSLIDQLEFLQDIDSAYQDPTTFEETEEFLDVKNFVRGKIDKVIELFIVNEN